MRANRLVNILNRDRVAFKLPRRDGATVQNKSGNIQPRQRHDSRGDGLVASDQNHERVKQIAARDQFNRIRDDFAADQRSTHALGAHGDAVGDGNGVEFKRCAACRANPGLDVFCQFAQVIVAGPDFDPGVGHADERFLEIVIFEAAGAQHGARSSAIRPVDECMAARFEL